MLNILDLQFNTSHSYLVAYRASFMLVNWQVWFQKRSDNFQGNQPFVLRTCRFLEGEILWFLRIRNGIDHASEA